ncbi:MAG TPA: hypothetical protein VMD59_20295 [Acidimicrobiales bacterium]|nr:hypothetical protein [Acidimicrobiales bacterium]
MAAVGLTAVLGAAPAGTAAASAVRSSASGDAYAVPAVTGSTCTPKPQNTKVTNQSVTFPFASYGISTGRIRQTSPTVATVTIGGVAETIVAFGDEDGVLHVVDAATCQELPGWPQRLAVPRGAPPSAHPVIESTPAIGWLDGPDAPPSIVVGAGSTWENTGIGEVEAFDLNGRQRWVRFVRATPGNANGVFSSPAIGDVGGGGQQDVVFGSWDYHVYVLDAAGKSLPGTPYYNAETIWSSPALFQMPGRQTDDIFIGLDKTQTERVGGCVGGFVTDLRYGIVPATGDRGLYVVHQSGCQGAAPGKHLGQAVWSSPAVGYLAARGPKASPSLERGRAAGVTTDPVVAVGTSWNDQPFGYGTNKLYVYDARTMQLLWSATTDGPVFGSPAIGVLAGVDEAAVVDTSFVCSQPIALDRLGNCLKTNVSEVDAWSPTGRLIWEQRLIGPTDLGSPVLTPLLGESGNDVLVGSPDGLYPLAGGDGHFLYGTSILGPQRAIHPGCRLFNTPAVADVVGAGRYGGWYAFELCSDGTESTGGLYAFRLPKAPQAAPAWPMFRADPDHTGVAYTTLPDDPLPPGVLGPTGAT